MKLKQLFHIIRNKYLIATGIFLASILFFDRNDFFTQRERQQELEALLEKKAFYEKEIAKTQKELNELQNSPAAIEKYAREQLYMKRPNEDIFILETPSGK
ncbi:MAG TPA: septum formation initiator [Chitinophagaceae bacterium]|nr:septum formation initiator [Chitinophagaceae bacterium]HAN40183.1 septum formation initiator [Chitinophagaceae bacterium]